MQSNAKLYYKMNFKKQENTFSILKYILDKCKYRCICLKISLSKTYWKCMYANIFETYYLYIFAHFEYILNIYVKIYLCTALF